MSGDDIPDDLWRKILEIGVKSSIFSYKDLCSISISSRNLCRLSCENSLWILMLSFDFPSHNDSSTSFLSPVKFIYKERFEREKERKLSANRRALRRKEIEISKLGQRIIRLETRLPKMIERLQAAPVELAELQKIRQALNSWQDRLRALKLRLTYAKSKSRMENKHRLDMAIKERDFMKCHPFRMSKHCQPEQPRGYTFDQ